MTRETASELLETISPERIEKIENERSLPNPDEVLLMAEKYQAPSLCNYYCARQCPIGQQYVPEIKIKDLSQIILEMLAGLHPDVDFERETALVTDGILDSFDLVSLVSELGGEFDIRITAKDFAEENFNSLDALTAMVERLAEE